MTKWKHVDVNKYITQNAEHNDTRLTGLHDVRPMLQTKHLIWIKVPNSLATGCAATTTTTATPHQHTSACLTPTGPIARRKHPVSSKTHLTLPVTRLSFCPQESATGPSKRAPQD